MLRKREAGVLLHISSLPGKEGVGTLGENAYDFADWLNENGFSVWQILPVNHAGYCQSPYLALSAFAGNPMYIDIEMLQKKYNIPIEQRRHKHCDIIDYGKVLPEKMKLLKEVFSIVSETLNSSTNFISFCNSESIWLDKYALFASFREMHDYVSLPEMPLKFRKSDENEIAENLTIFKEEILFYKFIQFEFSEQWKALKSYANKRGVKIMGDLPIYVAYDSCDVWQNKELFSVDDDLNITELAGVPPDYFSKTGQLWGNPVYKWEKHKEENYDWWKRRVKKSLEMFDMIRIDHFRGFAEYWTVPAGSETAVSGRWEKGPGIGFFREVFLQEDLDRVVAEDLGVASEGLLLMLEDLKLPGMKVLQFAFDESHGNTHKPLYYNMNSVVYTGTHDNNTLKGWLASLNNDEIKRLLEYTGCNIKNVHTAVIREAMSSVALLCIIPMQDILELGEEARMNVPGTIEGNWLWRMNPGFSKKCINVKEMIKTYERSV